MHSGARFERTIRAPARLRLVSARGIARHLVLAYRPGWQSLADLHAIAAHVRDIDPTIATFVVPATHRSPVVRRSAAERPTLIFSAAALTAFAPQRGKIYQGKPIAKIEQLRRLQAAGVATPRTAVLTPDLPLDPGEWGEFVVVKPTDTVTSSHGTGIQLMRTARVRYRPRTSFPNGHPGRRGPMLVQQFIDTGERISSIRVLTLFGEALYCMADVSQTPRAALAASDDEIERTVIATQAAKTQEKVYLESADVLELARNAHRAIPEVPLKGCDILREASTGKLYVLEMNCGGNTWHFSSGQQARARVENGAEFERQRYLQFDAMRTAARVLVARTNAEAV